MASELRVSTNCWDSLKLFKIGFSWGGVTSLAVPFFDLSREHAPKTERLVRFNIGLERTDDLISDLEVAFSKLPGWQ